MRRKAFDKRKMRVRNNIRGIAGTVTVAGSRLAVLVAALFVSPGALAAGTQNPAAAAVDSVTAGKTVYHISPDRDFLFGSPGGSSISVTGWARWRSIAAEP